MSHTRTKLLFVSAALFALPATGFAMPTVEANILTWPDDGWYQVQRADTFVTVCEGSDSATSSSSGGPCMIDGSNHIVINHTSGERFDNITAMSGTATTPDSLPVVPDSSPFASVNTVMVAGSRIIWPDDGWYQVQNTETYATVCEGAAFCDVDAGNYVVINHSSGERFEDVVVTAVSDSGNSAMTDNPSVTAVTVVGQMLSWPNDGWYQVQDTSTFATVCEGGTGCSVEPGNYVVINHSSGERFEDIAVGSGMDGSTGNTGDNNTGGNMSQPGAVVVNGNLIQWPDDGWYQVQNAQSFATICEGGSQCAVSPGDYLVINHSNGMRTTVNVAGDSTNSGNGADDAVLYPVDFEITVPVYVSDSLQVRIAFGDTEQTAAWVVDETWVASVNLPADTQDDLIVTFSDRNGEIVLGTFETSFRSGSSSMGTFGISADQFDTARWDNDADGVSNLAELMAGTDPLVAGSLAQNSIRVNIGLTVPTYMSDSLQVRLVWGDMELEASWAGDESWTAFGDFPSDVQQPLTITFSDRNGDLELGSYETTYRTGTNESEYVQFEARQINTNRFDRDLDGISNYAEVNVGTDPLVSEPTTPVTFESVQSRLRRSCSGCHSIYRSGTDPNGITHERLLSIVSSRATEGEGQFVVPFDAENSYLIRKMEGDDGISGGAMLSNRASLPQLVRAWIAMGALNN